jgi:predicted ribosome quality control (RQC) complex YloA/Tae2 family protein
MGIDLSSYDLYKWLEENSTLFIGSYIQNAYQADERIILKIHNKEFGKKEFIIDFRGAIYFGEREEIEISNFVKKLREIVENLKVSNIQQINFDRIIRIDTFIGVSIIIELFREGNLIILKNETIELVFRPREWKTRVLKKGELYKTPPQFKDPAHIDSETFVNLFLNSDKSVVKTLAVVLNMGKYAEELCYRASIDADKISNTIPKNELLKLYELLKQFLKEPIKPCIIDDFGASAIQLNLKKCVKEFDTFNNAIKELFLIKEEIKSENLKIYERQLKALEEMENQETSLINTGELIYRRYQELEFLLEELKDNIDRVGWTEIYKNPGSYKKVDPKNKSVVVAIPEQIILSPEKTLNQSAQHYYDEAKKLRNKIENLKKIIKKPVEKKVVKKVIEKRRVFWFEKYRWFICSDDTIIIGGKDAKTNEEVVKKYLSEKDKYVHADIHGASSVVVKGESSEKCLEEACTFSLAFSKAWNAGYHAGDSYWVNYSQVSKMGESGEYVTKGAWIIRGKRNYFHNLKIELAIGMINYERTDLLMIGPISALDRLSKHYIIIEPGEEKKSDISKKIKAVFNVPEEEILKLLPGSTAKIIKEIKK